MEKIDGTRVREAIELLMEFKARTGPDAFLNAALAALHAASTGKNCSPEGPVGPDLRSPALVEQNALLEKVDALPVREAVRLLMECKKRTPPDPVLLNTALALLNVALTGENCSPEGPVGPDFRRPRT